MELRLTAGIYKNRSVKVPKKGVRPTLVRARTYIFDVLLNLLGKGFSFLDVFAGSGIMGMEALSREASNVVFFDINLESIKLINENLRQMEKIPGTYMVRKQNALVPCKGGKMDVIFLDPPYECSFIIPDVLKKLNKYGWIGESTLIITEVNKKEKDFTFPFDVEFIKEKLISRSLIKFHKVKIPQKIEI
jgi:16S rRNA (guanine966-N2)-methyltransferase